MASSPAQQLGRQIEVTPQGEHAKIDASIIVRDMSVLAKRNEAEKDALVKKIKNNPGDYAPPVFMFMAQRLLQKKDAKAVYFWFCFGRLRGHYDSARCADVSAQEGIAAITRNMTPN